MKFTPRTLSAFVFCFLSFCAFAWYQVTAAPGHGDFASSRSGFELIKTITSANSKVSDLKFADDDMSCSCKSGEVENVVAYETPDQCGPTRNYFEKNIQDFKAVDPNSYYTKARASSSADNAILPKKCSVYIMKSFWKNHAMTPDEKLAADIEFNKTADKDKVRDIKDISEYKEDAHLFSTCGAPQPQLDANGNIKLRTHEDKDANGNVIASSTYQDIIQIPTRVPDKPCVTEDYVNVVHNSLLDVVDCMDLPAKFMAPKLANESGLHPNAYAKGLDGGIGQFTPSAIRDIYDNYDNTMSRIDMNKASCRRIASIPGAIPKNKKEILSDDDQRCYMIESPPNPLRSLMLYGIFFKNTKRNSEGAWASTRAGKSAEQLMDDAGIGSFDKDKIKEMMFIMAYNSGPAQPIRYFKEWLQYRLTTLDKYPIKKKDFEMNFWPSSALFKTDRGDARAKELSKDGPMTLAQYLFAYKDSIYIPAVKAQANKLDKAMGEGTCTEDNFLSL